MKVQFFGPVRDIGYGNIIWDGQYKARPRGQFLQPHPCHANPRPTVFSREEQPASDDPLGRFRALGYLASCFPEGDGISFDPPPGRTHEQQVADVTECFGFEVQVLRK